jgi:hypothetical protein
MKRLFLIWAIVLFSTVLSADAQSVKRDDAPVRQNWEYEDWDLPSLYGDVVSVEYFEKRYAKHFTKLVSFEFDECGDVVKRVFWNADGSIDYDHRIVYDQRRRMTEEASYDGDGNLYAKHQYLYDDCDRVVCERHYNSDGQIYNEVSTTYDEAGGIALCKAYVSNNGIFYWYERRYDSQGNMVEEISYNADGSIEFRNEYNYDYELNTTEYLSYDGDSRQADGRCYVIYDDNGAVVKSFSYDDDGDLESYKVYETDEAGRNTKISFFNALGELDSYEIYEYNALGIRCRIAGFDAEDSMLYDYNYLYNDYGQPLILDERNRNGLVCRDEYEYDEDGRILSSQSYYSDDDYNRTVYSYDAKGNQLSWKIYHNGKRRPTIEVKYVIKYRKR